MRSKTWGWAATLLAATSVVGSTGPAHAGPEKDRAPVSVDANAIASLWGDDDSKEGKRARENGAWNAALDDGSMFSLTAANGIQQAWARGATGEHVTVALVDTGIAPVAGLNAHDGKVMDGPDLSYESQADGTRYVDGFGHGTHLAGIIAGEDEHYDPKQPSPYLFGGVAPEAQLLNMKVATGDGGTDVSQVIAAIDWVVEHRKDAGMNVRVMNLSYGTDSVQSWQVDPLARAVERAWRSGIVVVAAAGNGGAESTSLTMPAADPHVIAVGAVDHQGTPGTSDDVVADFTSAGSSARRPDVLAPGKSVVSLRVPRSFADTEHPEGAVKNDGQGRFFRGSGTSQAAAVVTGEVALLLDENPSLTPDQVKGLLMGTARPLQADRNASQGAGVVDVVAALDYLKSKRPVPAATTATLPFSTGLGSLEAARGGEHVVDPATGDMLVGEYDALGTAWTPQAWAQAQERGASVGRGHVPRADVGRPQVGEEEAPAGGLDRACPGVVCRGRTTPGPPTSGRPAPGGATPGGPAPGAPTTGWRAPGAATADAGPEIRSAAAVGPIERSTGRRGWADRRRTMFRGLLGAPARETLRVVALTGALVVVCAGLCVAIALVSPPARLGFAIPWWAFAVAFALTESAVLHVQTRREAETVSISELPLVVGLFFAEPTDLLVGRLVGSLAIFVLVRRSSLLKTSFNTALVATETLVAVLVFSSLAGGEAAIEPRQWAAALAAALVANATGAVVLGLVIGIYEGQMSLRSLATGAVTGQAFAPGVVVLALVAVICLDAGGWEPAVVGAAVVVLTLCYHSYSSLFDRHVSLERLYDFSQAVGRSSEKDVVLTLVLDEVRELLTSEHARLVVGAGGAHSQIVRIVMGEHGELEQTSPGHDAEPDWVEEQVLLDGRAVVLGRRSRGARQRAWLRANGLRDAVAVPLHGTDGVLGMLLVGERLGEVRTYNDNDVLLLETVANHASVALQNGQLIEQLQHDALHDALTGLPNRKQFQRELEAALGARTEDAESVAVVILDLDGFKDVNDTLGHHHGDLVLTEVAGRLLRSVGDRGCVARLGGDEFAVLFPQTSRAATLAVCQRIITGMQGTIEMGDMLFEVGASFGIAHGADADFTGSTLMKQADLAMYEAKSSGLRVCEYTAGSETTAARRLTLATELRAAIAAGTVEVHMQPQEDVSTGEVHSVEALARWTHHELGVVSPVEFIPVAERSGLIGPLTTAVLDVSLQAAAGWAGVPVSVSVNLSPRSLLDPALLDNVSDALERWHVRAPAPRPGGDRGGRDDQPGPGDRAPPQAQGARGPALDRRLRDGLLLPVLPQGAAGPRGEDRPQLRDRARHEQPGPRHRPLDHHPRLRTSASTWSPRASRTRRPTTCSRRWAAPASKAGTSHARCPSTTSPSGSRGVRRVRCSTPRWCWSTRSAATSPAPRLVELAHDAAARFGV